MAHVRRRGPNTYEIRVYLGRDAEDKKKYLIETFHGTRGQAQRRAAELEVLHRPRMSGPQKAAITLGEYLDRWLARIKGAVAARTWENYAWHAQRLKAAAGNLPLYGLTAGDIQDALAELTGSPRTVKDSFAVLRTALRQAVAWGLIPADPTFGVKPPRVPRQQKRVLTRDELLRLLEAARPLKHYLVVRVLALTGLRLGEALGIKWRDVDFREHTLTVRQSVDVRRRAVNDRPKTDAAVRAIRLDAETVRLLREHRRAQAENQVTPLRRDADLVFRSGDGRPLKESAVRKTLNRALKRAGLSHITVHGLRHTVGSLLLDAGLTVAEVSAYLGHSAPATTAAIYLHPVRKGRSLADVLGLARDSQADSQAGRKP